MPREKWSPPLLDPVPPGITVVRTYRNGHSLVECSHHENDRMIVKTRNVGPTFGGPRTMCGRCKGDTHTTEDFTLPVKFLAVVPEGVGAQATLI